MKLSLVYIAFGLVVAILAFVGVFSQDKVVEYIIAAAALWISGLLFIVSYITEIVVAEGNKAAGRNNNLVDLLKIDPIYVNDEWSRRQLVRFTKVITATHGKSPHITEHVEHMLEDFLNKTAEVASGSKIQFANARDGELRRLRHLTRVTRKASKHIHAVTFDKDDYLRLWWENEAIDEYFDANRCAIEKKPPVAIFRIFVARDETIDSQDSASHQLLKRIIRAHLDVNSNPKRLSVKVVRMSRLPEYIDGRPITSFLICDDKVVSESYDLAGRQGQGYVILDCEQYNEELLTLKARYRSIDFMDDESKRFDTKGDASAT